MIMPSKDNLYNGRKGIGFENPSYFERAKDLRPMLYDEKVIGLGYTLMFLTHSDEALEIEKFKRSRENKIEFAYDYGNLNASYIIIDLEDEVVNILEKEKANLETIESLKSKGFELSETVISKSENQNENDCHVNEKECDKVENPKVIAPGMFKLSVLQCVSPILMTKSSCDSNNVEIKLKRKRHKRKSSKQNDKQVNNDVSRANRDFVHCSDLDTFSSVRRPKHRDVIWKKKGSSNISNADLSSVSHLKLNKDVKRYSHKDLLLCNNSHLGETSSAYVCNDAMNVSCNSRMCDLLDDNNFFIFDDESVKISLVRKMPFRKKLCDYMIVRSKSNMNKSLPRTVHKWLPKLQPLAEPDVWICLWIIDSGCSKHMTGNHAFVTNFVEKFLGTVRFGNNDFAVIAGYGDVVIGLPKMKFEKDHLCFTCEQGKIHQKHHKSKTAFASNKPLYLLHMDLCGPIRIQSINGKRYVLVVVDDYSRYTWRVRTDNGTEFKNKTLAKFFDEAEAIATACFTQNCSIIRKRFDKTPYELMNKRKPNIKFFHVFGCRCYLLNDYEDVGKLKAKGDIGVFISDMASKQFSLEPGLPNLNKMGKSSNLSVSQVSEASKKDLEDLFQDFYDEYFDSSKIMKSPTTNVVSSNVEVLSHEEEVFHEISESFQGESTLSSFNDDVQQSPEELILPQTNTQSISINMIPNGDEASTSHNMFNERLEDAYFDASTSFHDPSNV
nr:hypothetical protein [Tanacetum cinerariifolium]